MAGQPPPEPSFQPSGQDQGLTRQRPAWQQSSYPPPPPPGSGPAGGHQAYAAPAYGQQEQAYAAKDQAYAAQDQAYAAQAQQGQGQDYQNYPGYQGYQAPDYGVQASQSQGAGAHAWPGTADARSGTRTKQQGEKGFLGALFDFSFSSMITPKIVKALYVLSAVMVLVGLIVIYLIGHATSHSVGAAIFFVLLIGTPFALLSLGVTRLVLEAAIVVFRIYEELKRIREQGENRG